MNDTLFAAAPVPSVIEVAVRSAPSRKLDDPNTFFERADQALYRAKERGKSQVVRAPGGNAPSDATRRPGTASNQ